MIVEKVLWMSTMQSRLLVTELKMELQCGLSRTHGELTGETRATSKSEEIQMNAPLLFATHIQQEFILGNFKSN